MTIGMRNEILGTMKKWLWIEDAMGVDLVLAVAIASMYPGDPVWAFIVDPPGALKTELCRSFPDGKYAYTVDTLTPQSLISGFSSKKENIDILSQLDGKLLIVKDFTTILQKPTPIRDELFGRLRSAYDGTLQAAFGSGRLKQTRHATFGILAAVTPMIDQYTTVHALLGERFLRIRTHYNRDRAARAAIKQSGNEKIMRAEISEIIRVALDFFAIKNKELPALKPETEEKILALADLVSILRTPVIRDYRHQVQQAPEAELATRLVKQLRRMVMSLVVLGNYTYSHIVRLAEDTSPSVRFSIMKGLYKDEMTIADIVRKLSLPYQFLSSVCEDLWMLKLIDRKLKGDGDSSSGRKPYLYSLKSEVRKKMEISKFGN